MNSICSFECNTPDVVFENFGDEVILLNLKSGNYYSLNPLGMAYWELLSQGVAGSDVGAYAKAFYSNGAEGPADATCIDSDLDGLLNEFLGEQLLRQSTAVRAVADIALQTEFPKLYAQPQLSKFNDVAEMLLLDPVHDVSDVGWPHPAPVTAASQEQGGR